MPSPRLPPPGRSGRRTALTAVAWALVAVPAAAHPIGYSALQLEERGAQLALGLDLHPLTVVDVLPGLDADRDAVLTEVELRASAGRLDEYLDRTLVVERGGARCPGVTTRPAELVTGDRLRLERQHDCGGRTGDVTLRVDALMEDEGGHTVLGQVRLGSAVTPRVFKTGDTVATFAVSPAAPLGPASDQPPGSSAADARPPPATARDGGALFASFLGEGVRHIFLGLDHVLFVAALALGAATLRALAWVVTAFTLAHSVTLALGALGVVRLSPSLVEPAIAASVVLVAVGSWPRGVGAVGAAGGAAAASAGRGARLHHPAVALLCGLLHGLGFAAVLSELGLPATVRVPALVAFNLGVEVGQLAVVAPVFLALRWLDRRSECALPVRRTAAAGVALAGAFWLAERLLG